MRAQVTALCVIVGEQIWVYEDADEDDGNLYVHHDILLPEFPLCVAWLDCPPSSSGREAGNLAAVGSMGPGIEIWNLNITDAVEPLAVLGGPLLPTEDQAVAQAEAAASQKKKKVKKKHKKQVWMSFMQGGCWPQR